jgi:hypothetical protein
MPPIPPRAVFVIDDDQAPIATFSAELNGDEFGTLALTESTPLLEAA